MSTAAFSTPGLLWSLVIPVKVLAIAKSRMSAAAGPYREALALSVAADTVAAALRSDRVSAVIVVTDDPVAARELGELGARIVPDTPDAGLNPALSHGAALARDLAPGAGVGALSADLPALRPDELSEGLGVAGASGGTAFVPDAAGVGTTLYVASPGAAFSPAFGPDSCARHRSQGARELALTGIASVRQDVDTLDDLLAALRLGTGPRT